ncbi:MAG: enoyl-[acyl-carrier-protein] reductase FabK [Oscillospiraceae bacterium]|nr:enoyl-[acyl-carrier-protein] reductase FabK [Oscillospiraceae bacterium]
MTTKLTELLGIRYPVIQGGMAWIAEAGLAAAVSEAGGVGLIAGGNAPADVIRKEILRARELTDKPFGVNIMLMSEHSADLMQLVCQERVAVVTTGAGSPGKYIESLKAAGVKVIPVVPSVALAKRMERAGADAVIAEGCEAGGHIGETTTMCLVPQIVDAVDIPVIAAGGIADGRGIAAALMLGAEGVQIGTLFLAADECKISQTYKQMLLDAKDTDSIVTGRITGHPVRSIKNRFTRNLLEHERENADPIKFGEMTSGSLKKAVVDGDKDEGSFMAGQIAGLIDKTEPAADQIERIFKEAEGVILGWQRQL